MTRDLVTSTASGASSTVRQDFHPQRLVAGIGVFGERRLIGEVRRALGGDHTGSGTSSYSPGTDECGNFGIAIVAIHNLSLSRSNTEQAIFVPCPCTALDVAQPHKVTSYFT